MNFTVLNDEELLRLAAHQYINNQHINNEWVSRFGLFFPYKLIDDKIYNCIMDEYVLDSDCDRMVVQQANILRNKSV